MATLVSADAASKSNPDVASCPMVSVSDPPVDKPNTSASTPASAVASPKVVFAVAAPVIEPDATNDVESEPTSNVVSFTPMTSSATPTEADASFLASVPEVPTLLADAVCVLDATAETDASVLFDCCYINCCYCIIINGCFRSTCMTCS